MIKHIVFWKLKESAEGKSKEFNAIEIKNRLEKLKDSIPQIFTIEVGINCYDGEAAYDIALYSEFKSHSDYEVYQNHPEHKAVVEFVKKVILDRKVVDYAV